MSKKKTSKPATATLLSETDDCPYDAQLREMVKSSQDGKSDGPEMFTVSDETARVICVKVPAVSLRFFMHLEGWLTGRLTMIDGVKESCKSAFTREVIRWHRLSRGFGFLIEAEEKDSALMTQSILGYSTADEMALPKYKAKTQEEWQNAYFNAAERIQLMMDGTKERKGLGRIAPIGIIVDSISSVVTQDIMNKMYEEGEASLNHPTGPRKLADFLRVSTKMMVDYPVSTMLVSHLKMASKPGSNVPERRTTGGDAPKFHMSHEIQMSRVQGDQGLRSTDPDFGSVFYIPLEMRTMKNSMGDKERISVDLCWFFDESDPDPLTGRPRQKSFFDWHASTVETLDYLATGGEGGYKGIHSSSKKRIRDLLELDLDTSKRRASSPPLGVSEKNPIPYRHLGQLIEEKIDSDPEFKRELYTALAIRTSHIFRPGVDHRQQIAENKQRQLDAVNATNAKLVKEADIPPASTSTPTES